jgi:hypothetical protein
LPITWTLEPHGLVLQCKGFYDTGDFARILAEAAPKAVGMPLLLDLRETASPSQVTREERFDVALSFMPPLTPRLAVIVSDRAQFELVYGLKTKAAKEGIDLGVFCSWESEAACLWLSKPGPRPT